MIFMPVIKSAASPDVVEAIQKIEDRADKCYEPLALLDLHPSVAVWALLVRGIGMIEAEIEQRGDNSPELTATLIKYQPVHPNCNELGGKAWKCFCSPGPQEVDC